MKRIILRRLISFMAFSAAFFVMTGGSRGNNGSTGQTWSEMTPCDSLITGEMVFTFNSVNLRYSLEEYGEAVMPDIHELASAHGVSAIDKKGSITMLSNLFLNTYSYTGDNAPSIKLKFSGADCSGYVEKIFKSSEGIFANQISIPQIDHSLIVNEMHAEAKSIKTNFHQLQLVWSASVSITQMNGSVEDGADVNGDLISITCQSPEANTLVVRPNDTGSYTIVENTVLGLEDLDGDFTVDFSVMSEVDCPSLKRIINAGGEESKDFEWEGPLIIPVEGNDTIGIE